MVSALKLQQYGSFNGGLLSKIALNLLTVNNWGPDVNPKLASHSVRKLRFLRRLLFYMYHIRKKNGDEY